MKKFSLLLSALAFLFFSCSENIENHDSKKSGNVTINISGSKNSGTYSSARFITPVESFDISQVKEWNVTFTPVTPAKAEKVTATLTPENGSVTATLGVGTYNFYMEGSYTISSDNGDTTVNLSGSKDGIVITEEKTTEFSVVVGLKKTAGGTGSFSVTFTFDDSDENGSSWTTYYTAYGTTTSDQKTDYSKGIKVVLTSNSDKNTEYSTENGYLTIDTTNAEDGKSLAVSNPSDKPIPSGFYNLSFFADYPSKAADGTTAVSVWQKITLNSDDLVEIADGRQTSDTFINLLFPVDVTQYTYYASDTGKEDANGLTQTNPGTLYSVLKNIYANKNITSASINYTYSDTIKLDVSKIGSGKSISVSCTTEDGASNDAPVFALNPDTSVSYTMYSNTLNFFTTDDSKKSVSVASGSDGTVILSDGVYMDLTSLDASSQMSISMDVGNPSYYEANPVAVYKTPSDGSASISFNFTKTSNFSEYTSDSASTVFTYDTNTTLDSESGLAKVYAQEPYVYVKYYGNTGTVTNYVIGNDGDKYFTTNSRSMASWCDDKNGGFYVFEAEAKNTGSYCLGTSPAYNLVHYKKIQKGASFILDKESVGTSVTVNVPVSVCTDGSNIYFVESALDISSYSGKSLDLGAWGSWAHKGCTVKYFSIESPSTVNELDFSSVFKGGKVTAVYHYNNGLYVAGYSRKSLGTVTVTSDNGSEKTEFFDSTFSVYKLADATDVSGAALVKDVFSNSTEDNTRIAKILNSSSTSSEEAWTDGDTRVKSYNAITDMAIMDGKLYVLENSYYYGSPYYYGSKGSLRQVSLESGSVTLIDKCDSDSTDTESFKVPNKILAVLPKKLKLIIADSGKVLNNTTGACYTVDLSDADKISVSEAVPSNASGHNFDNYSTGSDFFNSSAFTENSYYTSKASFEIYDE